MISAFLALTVSFVKLELSNFAKFEILSGCLTKVPFVTIFQYGWFFMMILTCENIEGMCVFLFKFGMHVY